ncbi:MAG: NAD-dependent epimerase/dehydratase family protein [Alphaproteobacteria bacterium]|nr:NAD-dependent epimerase/dehydratase family protein [Alphaproteobacteria bacterium]
MSKRLALVTGATGCLGQHLVGKLVEAGYRVRASGRNQMIGDRLHGGATEFVAGDLQDVGLVRKLVTGVDAVFHSAALSSPWGRYENFQAANVEVTRSLTDAALAASCQRFVHVSSPSVYFEYTDRLAIRENAPLAKSFANHYAASKADAERVVTAAAERGLVATILRPRGIYGEFDTALAPRLFEMARSGRVPLLRGGNALVDVTYAGNAAHAMVLCDRPNAPGGIYNITNGEPLTVRDLLVQTFRALGREVRLVAVPYGALSAVAGCWEWTAAALRLSEPRLLRYTMGVMAYSQTLDISAARRALGYAPRISFSEGLERYAAWLGQQAAASSPLQGSAT